MEQDESFGIIPLSKQSGEWQVFLVFHKHARYWGFPKGHAEGNETPEEAASREQRYIVKRVFYYIAEVTGTVKLQEKEIEGGVWVSLPDAMNQITHPEGKSIIALVEKLLIL
jgi:ADP-ribose pyrophosphatase YjhB (NUDIX family)